MSKKKNDNPYVEADNKRGPWGAGKGRGAANMQNAARIDRWEKKQAKKKAEAGVGIGTGGEAIFSEDMFNQPTLGSKLDEEFSIWGDQPAGLAGDRQTGMLPEDERLFLEDPSSGLSQDVPDGPNPLQEVIGNVDAAEQDLRAGVAKDKEKAAKVADDVKATDDTLTQLNDITENNTASDSFKSKTNEALAGFIPTLLGAAVGGAMYGKEGIGRGAVLAHDLKQAEDAQRAQAEQAQAKEQLAAIREEQKFQREQQGKLQIKAVDRDIALDKATIEAESKQIDRDHKEFLTKLKLDAQEKKDVKTGLEKLHKAAPKVAEEVARAPAMMAGVDHVMGKIEGLTEKDFGKVDTAFRKFTRGMAFKDVKTLKWQDMRTAMDQNVLSIIKEITGAQMTDAERQFIMQTVYQEGWSKKTVLTAWRSLQDTRVIKNKANFQAASVYGAKLPAEAYFLSTGAPKNIVSKLTTDKALQDRTKEDLIKELKTKYGLDAFAIREYILGDLFTLTIDDKTGLLDLVPKKKDK